MEGNEHPEEQKSKREKENVSFKKISKIKRARMAGEKKVLQKK